MILYVGSERLNNFSSIAAKNVTKTLFELGWLDQLEYACSKLMFFPHEHTYNFYTEGLCEEVHLTLWNVF